MITIFHWINKNKSYSFCVFAVVTLLLMQLIGSPQISQQLGTLKLIPYSVNGIVAKERPPSDEEKTGLPSDTYLRHAVYFDQDAGDYYDTGLVIAGNDRHSLHPPNECMVAAGWRILTTSEETVVHENETYKVNVLHLKKGNEDRAIFGFYIYTWVCAKRITPQYSKMLIYNTLDGISGKTYRWAYPSTLVFKKSDENPDHSLERGLDFFSSYMHQIMTDELKNELAL